MGAWDKGSTRAWRRIRAAVLEENRRTNGGRCAVGVPGVCTGGQATCVHHTQGRDVTGDDPRYLVASCRACNLHIGQPSKRSPRPRKVSKW
ncbi:hypothetical protein [Amycolatopsis sp. cmx-4-68]|uniref:hypothetical protein n=1 Tax=Amycolatopsis sp. cmx-4-68 TaxID=2790938 RepID=UPI00397C291C